MKILDAYRRRRPFHSNRKLGHLQNNHMVCNTWLGPLSPHLQHRPTYCLFPSQHFPSQQQEQVPKESTLPVSLRAAAATQKGQVSIQLIERNDLPVSYIATGPRRSYEFSFFHEYKQLACISFTEKLRPHGTVGSSHLALIDFDNLASFDDDDEMHGLLTIQFLLIHGNKSLSYGSSILLST
mmetsp:Transcript_3436/g.7822  ORF Transcript_3436/g.7822 Transcript_3436/m.7822 type:complete len:182 (+) Transcript_3436:264-809(+)